VGSAASRAVTCVIAKTKTRSKKSSSGVTRSTRSEASTERTLPDDENVAGRAPHEACAHGAVDQAPQPGAAPDNDHACSALFGRRADLTGRIPNGGPRGHPDLPLAEKSAR